jgi:hypothetical protein
MVKVFRKYQKYILIGGGSLLMLTFLINTPVQELFSDPARRVLATSDGRNIRAAEMDPYYREYGALEAFPPTAGRDPADGRDKVVISGTIVESPDHWYLLVKEAEAAGLVGEENDGIAFRDESKPRIAMMLASQQYGDPRFAEFMLRQNPEAFKQFLDQAGELMPTIENRAAGRIGSLTAFHKALARARGVERLIGTVAGAHRYSDRRSLIETREAASLARIDYVLVPGDRAADPAAQPTEDEIRAQFEQFKTAKPGNTETANGFGYLLPPRVKLEWIKVSREDVSKAIDLDPVAVQKRYQQKRDKYKGEFAAERPSVENEIRAERTEEVLTEIDRIIRQKVLAAVSRLPASGVFRELPPNWSEVRPSSQAIVDAVVSGVKTGSNVILPPPQIGSSGAAWLNASEVSKLPEIGFATVRIGNRQEQIADAVLGVRELNPKTDLPLQVGVTFIQSPVRDQLENRYYLTILDARPESAADSVEDVRAQVVADLSRVKGFAALSAGVDDLRKAAIDGGLEAVQKRFPPAAAEPGGKPAATELAIRRSVMLNRDEVQGQDAAIREEIFRRTVMDATAKLDPMMDPAKHPADVRTLAIALPRDLTVAIVRIDRPMPMTIESVRGMSENITNRARQRELSDLLVDESKSPFAFAAMAERHKWVSRVKQEDEGAPKPKPEAKPPAKTAG